MNSIRIACLVLLSLTISLSPSRSKATSPSVYEPGLDPGVGFNLISWANFGGSGPAIWENAVQSVHDAGFSEVSISPVRFIDLSTGAIATSSDKGPELSHIAAGISRAKSLGMRVTVNPFVEPENFSMWRGQYNPVPSSAASNTFWSDYEQYVVDVAQIAETNGADSLLVGTELRDITRNSGHNASWGSVISAANAQFSGSLGYAANWDNYQNGNLTSTIWQNPAIDFVGIESYFTNVLTNSQADASGAYPNPTFIGQVENAWNNKLDNEILPFAAALQTNGLPVEFTEVGYLPHNRTSVTPQSSQQPIDRDEQNMVFEGLMRALDGRLDTGDFLAAHIWNWGMPGTGSNAWDMGVSGGEPRAENIQTSQWLASFVGNPTEPDPPAATEVLYSFEDGTEGFFYPNFETEPASVLSSGPGVGATDGDNRLAINKPTSTWTWDARAQMSGDQLDTIQDAVNDNDEDYILELDVTYVSADLPAGLSLLDMHLSMETNLDLWTQLFPFAVINGATDATFRVEIPLSDFELTPGFSSANFHLGFAGNWQGAQDATIYVDRIALRDTTFVLPESGDFNNDGVVDAIDYAVWREMLGQTGTGLAADGNNDGQVDALDYDVWKTNFGTASTSAQQDSSAVPEPQAMLLFAMLTGLTTMIRRRR